MLSHSTSAEGQKTDPLDAAINDGINETINETIKHLVMVYGLDYCASEPCYQRLKSHIAEGINAMEGGEFAEAKELGRVNRVDPLGIMYLRVRGMWGIENPCGTLQSAAFDFRRENQGP